MARRKKDWLEPPEWWKRYRPIRWLAVGFMAYGLWSWIGVGQQAVELAREPHPETARFTAVLSNPVPLIEPLHSFMSVAEVQQRLSADGYQWQSTRIPTPGSHAYPPRNLDTLQVVGYVHLGVPGRLTLEFFNDRLYEAAFIPDQPEDYAPQLSRLGLMPDRDDNGRASLQRGPLRVVSNVWLAITEVGRSLGTIPRVIWQDTRLVEQRDAWDTRFAQAYADAQRD